MVWRERIFAKAAGNPRLARRSTILNYYRLSRNVGRFGSFTTSSNSPPTAST